MKKLSEKQKAIMMKALDVFYVQTDADKCPYETCMKAVTLLEYLDVPDQEKIRYNEPDEVEVCLARLLALHYAVLAMGTDCDKGPEGFVYFGLFLNISNTIVAICKLAEEGLDYQAMSLIRNLFELFMTLLIITDSPEKRAAFVSANEAEDARKVWHKYFTKTKFLQTLKEYCAEHPDLNKVIEDFQGWINENYGELSSYTHSDYPHLVCCSLSQNDEVGISRPNVWGEYITWQKRIYSQLCTVAVLAHVLFCYMLKDTANDITLDRLFGDNPRKEPHTGKEIVLELQNALESLVRYNNVS